MYESPIRLLVQQLETNIREQQDKQIFEAIQKYGVDVDRDELIKALAYDRAQYAQGYSDGRADAQRWISVEERPPEGEVIAANFAPDTQGFGEMIIGYAYAVKAFAADWEPGLYVAENDHVILRHVTHWMPKPPAPAKEDCP